MFGHCGGMQLSAANLLIASQQLARGVEQAPRDAQAQFEAALTKEKSPTSAAAFEPIEFKNLTPQAPTSPASALRSTAPRPSGQLGAKLDIRV